MSYKAPIAWHHGQFLQPQHFQLNDLNQQAIIANLLPLAQQYFWGFSQLEVDMVALERGQLIINQAKLFLPDGSYLDLAENAMVVSRMLSTELFQENADIEVSLGLKRLEENKSNASEMDEQHLSDIKTRYALNRDLQTVKDLYQNGPEATVPQLKYVLKIFFKHELQEIQGYDLLPLAKINKDNKSFSLASDFSPTIVCLNAYPLFWKTLQEQRLLLVNAFNFALTYKPNQEWYQLHLGDSELGKYLLAQTLHRLIPSILELLDDKNTHPFCLYQKARAAIHELSFYLSNKINNDDYGYLYQFVPNYDHRRPHVSLLATFERLHEIISQILNGPQFRVILKATGDHYVAQLPDQFLAGNDHFYLIIQGKKTLIKEFRDHILSSAKLTSSNAINDYIKHAIPGVPFNYLPSRPKGAPDVPGALYFEVDYKHHEWAKIIQQASVGFYPGNIEDPLNIELISARGG